MKKAYPHGPGGRRGPCWLAGAAHYLRRISGLRVDKKFIPSLDGAANAYSVVSSVQTSFSGPLSHLNLFSGNCCLFWFNEYSLSYLCCELLLTFHIVFVYLFRSTAFLSILLYCCFTLYIGYLPWVLDTYLVLIDWFISIKVAPPLLVNNYCNLPLLTCVMLSVFESTVWMTRVYRVEHNVRDGGGRGGGGKK